MRTALLAAELGNGFGHVGHLLLIARALAEHGFQPVFAVRDPVEVDPMLRAHGFPVLQAPYMMNRTGTDGKPSINSFADILAMIGVAEPTVLAALLRVWDGIISMVKPAIIVADYSPIACLAALGGPPVVAVGAGFCLPPPHVETFPTFRPGRPLMRTEDELLDVVKRVQASRARPAPATLPALLPADDHFVLSFAELDPYAPLRRKPAVGPLESAPTDQESSPAEGNGDQVFAYLAGDSLVAREVIRAIELAGLSGRGFVRAAHRLGALPSSGRFTWLTEPAPLDDALKDARLIIHHGGLTTTERTLFAKRAQLVIPRHLEQLLTGRALRTMGVGDTIEEASAEKIAKHMLVPAEWSGMATNAVRVGSAVRAHYAQSALPRIVEHCVALAT
jgi:rhamnosyltransferase subunit B